MKYLNYTWFRSGLIGILAGLIIVGGLLVLHSFEGFAFVEYGKQTLWGGILLLFTWLALVPLVIVEVGEYSGFAGGIGWIAVLFGFALTLLSYFGIGALFGWLLGSDDYR